MDENKEMNCNCEEMKFEQGPIRPYEPPNICMYDAPDEVIVIPVSVYKHLIRCEAAITLLDKLLDKYGEYSSERAKIMTIACEIIGKETGKKEEDPFDA